MKATSNLMQESKKQVSATEPASDRKPARPAFRFFKRGSRGPHGFVLERMLEVPPTERHAVRVLDIPAGKGVVSIPLSAAGFDVIACDLFPEYLQQSLQRLGGQPVETA